MVRGCAPAPDCAVCWLRHAAAPAVVVLSELCGMLGAWLCCAAHAWVPVGLVQHGMSRVWAFMPETCSSVESKQWPHMQVSLARSASKQVINH